MSLTPMCSAFSPFPRLVYLLLVWLGGLLGCFQLQAQCYPPIVRTLTIGCTDWVVASSWTPQGNVTHRWYTKYMYRAMTPRNVSWNYLLT